MKIFTDLHVCPVVSEHPVSVVHSDALPHPAKPQTKTAGKEGNQGGLPEKHTVRHTCSTNRDTYCIHTEGGFSYTQIPKNT